jgi:hypothetical protein
MMQTFPVDENFLFYSGNPLLNFTKIKSQIFAIYVRIRKLQNSGRMYLKEPVTSRPPYLEADEQCGENVQVNR